MRKSISQVKESSGHWFLFKRQKKRLTCWGLPLISEREIQEVSRFNFLKKISEKDTKEYDYKNLEGIKSLQVTCTYTCCPFSVSHGVKDLVFLSLRMKRCRTSPWYGIVKGFLLAQVNMPNYGMQKKQEKKKGRKTSLGKGGNLPDPRVTKNSGKSMKTSILWWNSLSFVSTSCP